MDVVFTCTQRRQVIHITVNMMNTSILLAHVMFNPASVLKPEKNGTIQV